MSLSEARTCQRQGPARGKALSEARPCQRQGPVRGKDLSEARTCQRQGPVRGKALSEANDLSQARPLKFLRPNRIWVIWDILCLANRGQERFWCNLPFPNNLHAWINWLSWPTFLSLIPWPQQSVNTFVLSRKNSVVFNGSLSELFRVYDLARGGGSYRDLGLYLDLLYLI